MRLWTLSTIGSHRRTETRFIETGWVYLVVVKKRGLRSESGIRTFVRKLIPDLIHEVNEPPACMVCCLTPPVRQYRRNCNTSNSKMKETSASADSTKNCGQQVTNPSEELRDGKLYQTNKLDNTFRQKQPVR
jgi:hypothetical protein